MGDLMPRLAIRLLIAAHLVLAAWALVGLTEYVVTEVPWPRIANPLFPGWVLLAQWLLVLLAAAVFLAGLAARWRRMPAALAVCYAAMASLCAYQTFVLLRNDGRFVAMGMEYAAYFAILVFLFSSDHVRTRLTASA